MLVVNYSFVLPKLRRKCNGVYLAYFLMDSFVEINVLTRQSSFIVELELDCLTRSIIEDLGVGKWPTGCLEKRKAIKAYVQNAQTQILTCKQEDRFDLIISHVFDLRNRIFAVDSVFMESKSSSFNQVGYSNLALEEDKFLLLKETKLSDLSKLPVCKVVMVEIPKVNGGKKSL